MSDIANSLRTPKEKAYGIATLLLGTLLWVLILWGAWKGFASNDPKTVGLTKLYVGYAVGFALFVWISSAFYRANAFGNMILLGPAQFPELYKMVVAGAEELGMHPPPKTFLYNSNGLVNAFARRLLGGPYVFLTSGLVEVNDDEQVRFVIGHELGHHAAGHLNPWLHVLRMPAFFIPFLRPAYSRAREYTCDKIGVRISKKNAISQSALQMLGCGCRRLNNGMNCEEFMAQEAMVPPIAGFITEIMRSHPRLTRRVIAIKD
jgi:Zn-dependent protease with chaperone function